ncbi:MAG: Autophagy protein 7 [Caeruleum heppii]|nr:MAG: Autophagy protein 7 [Caeruleum heppii]
MQFAPLVSDIELPFYTSLISHKINHDKLDDSARKLLGIYELRPTDSPEASCRMQVLGNALTTNDVSAGGYRAEGIIKNVNTIEEYRAMDKPAMLQRAGRTIWEAIKDGTIYSCPSLLASFAMLSFADLKKYKFTYWFAFPALHSDPTWKPVSSANTWQPTHLTGQDTAALVERVQTWRYSVDARQHGFFLVKKTKTNHRQPQDGSPDNLDDTQEPKTEGETPTTPGSSLDYTWEVAALESFESGFFDGVDSEDRFVAFADPSTYPRNPGWMLRNLLVLVRQRWKLDEVQIMCYRDTHARRFDARSVVLRLRSEVPPPTPAPAPQIDSEHSISDDLPKVTGWERNRDGKLASRTANLAEYLDPQRLADQSVDLNLKLIKWRIAPTLDLDKIKSTRCLLLGAGTLGSYVARNLLGWGVRTITFVDNANVSFSNPVRQPLFDFKDCLGGGALKAHRAAEALAEIYPGVVSAGHVLSVPMAGHPVTDEARCKADFDKLRELIEGHDAIFLLMDTRESRWLPTVMGRASRKIVMNAALGFDSFVVMRHGVEVEKGEEGLGCYFCNDVVAPADDRTLDQQCTVTRPGIAAIASALVVELLISLLQHPLGPRAPAPTSPCSERDPEDHPLGIVPHQIRGFLSRWENMVIRGREFDCCSACSDKVVGRYRKEGWGFVKRALGEEGFVEEVSGLAEIQRKAEEAAKDVEWDSEEGDVEDEGDGEMV